MWTFTLHSPNVIVVDDTLAAVVANVIRKVLRVPFITIHSGPRIPPGWPSPLPEFRSVNPRPVRLARRIKFREHER